MEHLESAPTPNSGLTQAWEREEQRPGWVQGWQEGSLTWLIFAQVGHFTGGPLLLRLTGDPASCASLFTFMEAGHMPGVKWTVMDLPSSADRKRKTGRRKAKAIGMQSAAVWSSGLDVMGAETVDGKSEYDRYNRSEWEKDTLQSIQREEETQIRVPGQKLMSHLPMDRDPERSSRAQG